MKLNEKLTGFLNQKKNLNDQNCIATLKEVKKIYIFNKL